MARATDQNSGLREISERLQAARIRARLRQVDLARALGVCQSTVTQWENGTTTPTAVHLAALAKLLGLSFLEPLRIIYSPRWVQVPFLANREIAAGRPRPLPKRRSRRDSAPMPVELVDALDWTRCVPVHGDSMSPEIEDGWIAAIDMREQDVDRLDRQLVAANAVDQGGVVVKRLHVTQRQVGLESANDRYPDLRYDRRRLAQHFIIGRIVAVRNDGGEVWAP